MAKGSTLHVVSNIRGELVNVTSQEGFFTSMVHAYQNPSDESNSMTSKAQVHASHVTRKSWTDSTNHSSRSTPAYQSETFLDHDAAWNQSKKQSSNGVSHPARGIFIGPSSMSTSKDSAHISGNEVALQPEEITTLMIQGLPRQCIPTMLAAEIDRSGFAENYDFVYVPTVFKPGHGQCYAFVNFVSAEVAMKFQQEWKRSWRFQTIGRRTRINVVKARIQGLQANINK